MNIVTTAFLFHITVILNKQRSRSSVGRAGNGNQMFLPDSRSQHFELSLGEILNSKWLLKERAWGWEGMCE